MTWCFQPMLRGDLNVDPFEQEFFATEALGSLTDALVRESVQNALDAGASEAPVCIRFALGSSNEAVVEPYLSGLWPHVEAALPSPPAQPACGSRVPYLLIEDSGTRGLAGDPAQFEDDEDGADDPRNDFYYFWRNVGRSRKGDLDRGRWGLGKTVFPAASAVCAFFGLTARAGEARTLLMGQAVLLIHRVGTRRFRPYGYYGVHEKGLTLPVDFSAETGRFSDAFGVERRGTPGLSLVIPFPHEEITYDALVTSVLQHYYQPLLAGKLEVLVAEGRQKARLSRDTLDHFVRAARREAVRDIRPLLSLARWGEAPAPAARARLAPPPTGRAPKLEEGLLTPADRRRLTRRFEAGKRIAVTVRVPIEPMNQEATEGSFLLLMERSEGESRGLGNFIRQGITIANPTARRPRGVRWIAVVDEPTLSAFLGDAENPAHTEWQRGSPKFKARYKRGPSTLDFVKAVPHRLGAILTRPSTGRDPDLLRRVFSLPVDAAIEGPGRTRPTREAGGEIQTSTAEVGQITKSSGLRLTRSEQGFRLAGTVESVPRRMRLLAAYEVLRGDPFKRYSPHDFRFDRRPVRAEAQGARVLEREANRIELLVENLSFEVTVRGFDSRRDLRIKVQPVETEA